jgi:thiamine transport system permease protein
MDRHLRLNRRGRVTRLALWSAPALFIAVLFYLPLGSILIRGLNAGTLSVLTDRGVQNAIWFTLAQAGASVLLALAIGLPLAYLLYRRTFFGAAALRNFLVIPFVLPTIIVVIALQPIRVLPAPIAIVIANLFLNLSLVIRIVGSVWRNIDSNLDDAAALDGASTLQVVTRVHLLILRQAIGSAAALVFLYCATSFGIVLVFGSPKYQSIETTTYFALNERLDFNTASALAIVQTLITLIAFALSSRNSEPATEIETRAPRRASALGAIIGGAFLIGFFVIPLASILVRGLNLDALANLSTLGNRGLLDISVWQAIGNSLRNAAIAAALATTLGTLVARLSAGRAWLQSAWLLPLGVSSVMLGFGYLVSFGSGPLPLRSSWMVVPLVQAILATPLVLRQVAAAYAGIPTELAEAAANAGAGGLQIWRHIEAPLIATAIRNSAAFALLVSLGEFGAASLLSFGDQATLPVVLYRLISRPGAQNYSMALAAAALLIILVFVVVALTSIRRRKQ